MSTAEQQNTFTTGQNVTATILNTEIGNIITHLNSIYAFVDISGGDVSLKPTSNGDIVEIEKMPRDNSGSATYIDSHIQSGWGYIQGDDTTAIEETVTLPVSYSDTTYRVVASGAGLKSTVPTKEGDANGDSYGTIITINDITTSSFQIQLKNVDGFNVSKYYIYHWIAIGPT